MFIVYSNIFMQNDNSKNGAFGDFVYLKPVSHKKPYKMHKNGFFFMDVEFLI